MLLFALPISLIFARLYYVTFNLDYYLSFPGDIIKIWNGGIAIYGAIIGACLTALVFCKVRKVKIGAMLDIGALGLMIGQSIGRWGNFVNCEAFGSETNLPWAMVISKTREVSEQVGVHPTFLYESLWNALGFLLLHFYSKKFRKFRGGGLFTLCSLVWNWQVLY